MKIQCDVCEKKEASVYCTADEASLCGGCDRRVHHANKLASKHPRFSLLHPSFKDSPLCDICQKRRALLFCKEDRAILCRECDIPIHKANEHTQNHNRFLLTGVKLSASTSSYSASHQTTSSSNGSSSVSKEISPSPSSVRRTLESSSVNQEGASMATRSISEYLMETLPGWHVEDFLDPSHPYGYCKTYDSKLPVMGNDGETNLDCFWSEDLGDWVPATADYISLTSLSKGLK